ncbi:hypothetical protein B0H63DRAFT_50755 [Podospora didyma]|uniref:Uncharacterized protein n=1 Tax=Podospora didyma TaxID=330526 RepID=A0AAE0P7A7_9PEZI|nr:hypothetical protein B0H63DRAFT_50755 [Podospora didyma]
MIFGGRGAVQSRECLVVRVVITRFLFSPMVCMHGSVLFPPIIPWIVVVVAVGKRMWAMASTSSLCLFLGVLPFASSPVREQILYLYQLYLWFNSANAVPVSTS